MQLTGIIDLHCDTLTDSSYTSQGVEDTLNDPTRVISLDKVPQGTKWAQCFAIFIPDTCRGAEAIDYFERHCESFYRQMDKYCDLVSPCRTLEDIDAAFADKKFAAILTVEGGAALAGDLSCVEKLANAGVKMVTLVWNGENEIGSGHKTENGLSEFGKLVIPELEKHNIIIDVSHLNDPGFEDLLKIAKKPFVASHSNARAITPHRRNLTDEHIKEIAKRGGLIGINYYVNFLREDGKVESLDDVYQHIAHMVSLGAGHCIALGSDFDGASLPECLNSFEKVFNIYDYLIERGMDAQLVDDIFYGNARRFFAENL